MIKLFEVGHNWDDESGLISQHKTKKAAEKLANLKKRTERAMETIAQIESISDEKKGGQMVYE